MLFKLLGRPPGKKKQKTRQLWKREFNVVNKGLDEKQVIAFVDDLIANQEAERVRLISQAKREANEIAPEVTGAEKAEERVQLQEASAPTEAVETASESPDRRGMEEKPVKETTVVPVDSGELYVGEIELHIADPVDVKMASKLFNMLQTTSRIKIIQTSVSRETGTVITVMLEKPTPLIALVSTVDGLEAKIEKPGTDDSVKEKDYSLRGQTRKEEVQRIAVTYKSKGQHS